MSTATDIELLAKWMGFEYDAKVRAVFKDGGERWHPDRDLNHIAEVEQGLIEEGRKLALYNALWKIFREVSGTAYAEIDMAFATAAQRFRACVAVVRELEAGE